MSEAHLKVFDGVLKVCTLLSPPRREVAVSLLRRELPLTARLLGVRAAALAAQRPGQQLSALEQLRASRQTRRKAGRTEGDQTDEVPAA